MASPFPKPPSGLQGQLQAITASVKQLSEAAVESFQKISTAVESFVKQGVAASSTGQLLTFQLSQLARTVAGLFGPEIRKVTELIQQFTIWINSLTEAQKENIARWLVGVTVATSFLVILPRLVSGISSVVGAVKTLTAIGGPLLPLLASLLAAFTAVGIASQVGSAGVGPLGTALAKLGSALIELVGKLVNAVLPVIELIGNLLLPLINALTDAVQWLTSMINTDTIAWLAAAAAFVAVISIIPRVVSAVMTVVNAIRALNVALAIKNALSGPAGWAQLAIGVAAAAAAVGTFYAIENSAASANANLGKGTTGKGKGGRGALPPPAGGFEDISKAWERFASASIMATAGKSPTQTTHDLLGNIVTEQKGTTQAVNNIKPAVVK